MLSLHKGRDSHFVLPSPTHAWPQALFALHATYLGAPWQMAVQGDEEAPTVFPCLTPGSSLPTVNGTLHTLASP